MHQRRIIIVDDDQQLASIYKTALEKKYTVDVISNGQLVMDQTLNLHPDLIILDIMLGGKVNGFDILRRLKQNPTTASIPIVMASNLDDQKDTAIDMGAAAYLIKVETDINQLLHQVDLLLD